MPEHTADEAEPARHGDRFARSPGPLNRSRATLSKPLRLPALSPSVDLWLLAAFLGFVFLLGGASRADAASQPVLRVISVVALGFWAFRLGRAHFGRARAPWLFLAGAAAIIAVQLVPLPPALWTALPGRELYLEGYRVAGIQPGWHALSLSPDGSLNTLLALLPPAATAAGVSMLEREQYPHLVMVVIGFILLSALFAIVEITSGRLYLYEITNEGSAVGLFANRNHQALLLASAFPLVASMVAQARAGRGSQVMPSLAGWMVGILLVPLLLVTGSRAGLFLGVLGAFLALAVAWRRNDRTRPAQKGLRRFWSLAPLAVIVLAGVATVFASRDVALQRLLNEAPGSDDRTVNLDVYVQMVRDFLPFGSGFGSFEPVYRIYEPFEGLRLTYLNHAHNDLAEVAIEGGVVGMAFILSFLTWFVVRTARIWIAGDGRPDIMGRVGSAVTLMILLGSVADYPIRTPIFSCVIMIMMFLMLPRSNAAPQPNASLEHRAASANDPTSAP